jgi:hypothetical protein
MFQRKDMTLSAERKHIWCPNAIIARSQWTSEREKGRALNSRQVEKLGDKGATRLYVRKMVHRIALT